MSSFDVDRIIQAIRNVLPENDFVPLHEPHFGGNEWTYVRDCLNTGWVSSVGEYVERFEQQLAEFTGARRAVAVVNGTAALHIALTLVGVEPNDEVLMPALTFVATANAVTYCGAVPHFVDSEERTLGLDPHKLADYLQEIADARGDTCYNKVTGRRIRAVVPMHTFGHPVDMDPLMDVCERFKLELVEDAAESLGSYYKGVHTGNFGKVAAVSFNGNKIITTGGGGAILTNDDKLADLAKHLTTTAKVPHPWEYYHDQIGYNYRMPNINAALGLAQLEQLPQLIKRKRELADKYRKAFASIEGVSFLQEAEFARSNYWLNVLLLDEPDLQWRDRLLEAMNEAGIMARPAWRLMNQLPMYKDCPKMSLQSVENLKKRIVNIPSSACLGE